MKTPTRHTISSKLISLDVVLVSRLFCHELGVQFPRPTEFLDNSFGRNRFSSEKKLRSREDSRDSEDLKGEDFFLFSSLIATMSTQNKTASGAGQFVPLSKTFRPNKNTTNDLVIVAKAKGETPPIGSVASEWRTIPVQRLEVLERCSFMMKLMGFKETPIEYQEFLMYQYELAEFAKFINPKVPEHLRAKDAPKIGPVRANKSISKYRRKPYRKIRRPDPDIKPDPSKVEADLIVNAFKELKFISEEMEFTFIKQWPKCFGTYGAWIRSMSTRNPDAFGFHKVSVYIQGYDDIKVALDPSESQFENLCYAAAFYFDKDITKILARTKVTKIHDLWCYARPHCRQLEKKHKTRVRMERMDLSN